MDEEWGKKMRSCEKEKMFEGGGRKRGGGGRGGEIELGRTEEVREKIVIGRFLRF